MADGSPTEIPAACPEWQDDLSGLLVAQLAPDREALLREHLAVCERCRAEAESLQGVAAVSLAMPVPPLGSPTVPADAPPPDLGERVLAAVGAERRARRGVRAGLVALVAAAVLVTGAVAVNRAGQSLEGEPIAFAVQPAGASVSAVLAADDGDSVVELAATGLDPEVTYALWLSPPGGGLDDRVPAGTFRPDATGRVDARLRSALPPDRYGRAWATTPDGDVALDTQAAADYRP
jgi:hypothetical protein